MYDFQTIFITEHSLSKRVRAICSAEEDHSESDTVAIAAVPVSSALLTDDVGDE